jgi:DNA polymerase-3 subunit epsilon
MMIKAKELDLRDLPVLVLDCQAAGGKPGKGFLLEMGWLRVTANESLDPELFGKKTESFLIKRTVENKIPKSVTKITGISSEDLESGVTEKYIWDQILYAAGKIMRSTGLKLCPVVIHYSRYEEPFIRYLFEQYGGSRKFPFTIICTHKIMGRLFPGLPQKGLRAAAGYFGLSLPDFRRCREHVAATAYIWFHLVSLLEKDQSVYTFEDLNDWMESNPVCKNEKKPGRDYPLDKKYLKDLPDLPGIYRMYRSNGDLLYIGKARSLKKRVNSYFRGKGQHAEHILEMLSQARSLDISITSTALEAAIRESDEIKDYSPLYNRSLKYHGRELVFFNPHLDKVSPKPGPVYRLGPFPHTRFIQPLCLIMDILNEKNKKISVEAIERILNISPEYCPDPVCFRQGMDLFKEEFFIDRSLDIILSDLKSLGVLFWKEKLATSRESEKKDEEEYEQGEAEDTSDSHSEEEALPLVWTPERIYAALKSIIRTGIFYIRRAHWFCRLCDSSLVWETDRADDYFLLKIEAGNFRTVESFMPEGEISIPTGYKKNRFERQKCFDIGTYDRMRVLTTEIRRILSERREVKICFSPCLTLRTGQIKRLLEWV